VHEKQCPGGHLFFFRSMSCQSQLQNKSFFFLLKHLQNAAVEERAMAEVLEK